MEALGGAASVIAVYNQLEECIHGLRRLYRNFKFAKQEVRQLIDEASACQSLSEIFDDICRPVKSKVIELARQKRLDKVLQTQVTSAREQIDHMTTKLQPLMEGGRPGQLDQIIAKIRWHFTKHEGQTLLVTLGTVKHSLTLLACLLSLDNTLTKLSLSSSTPQNYDLLLKQINRLEKSVTRQNKSLKKLVDRVNHKTLNIHELRSIKSTRSMVAVIQQIQNEPVTEARAAIARQRLNASRAPAQTRSVQDSTIIRDSIIRGLANEQSLPANVSVHSVASREILEASHQAHLNDSNERRRHRRRAVIQDYGDGNREHYEPDLSSSPVHNGYNNHTLFVPVPPFTLDDWQSKNQRGGRGGND